MPDKSYLSFVLVHEGEKTNQWGVCAKGAMTPDSALGVVKWFSHWRKYCFFPKDAIFDAGCLREIATFCETETDRHRRLQMEVRDAG